ncbi:hypothetical protein DPX16_3501 [Anabarilius grahami]|uniref:Uncharacterized protein n=1 Tax=Anabarilius grahami TaxID=495550 RepID=A0A3N0Y6R1_ANAGA|nr:hypothetical protein DPX16_3501 [Anabarilius grahami]
MSQTQRGQQAEQNDPLQLPAKASATFSINLPESFDFSKPQDWEKWIRRFERFRVASDLDKSSNANQNGETDGDGLMEETNIYVNSVIANLPASETYLSELRAQLSADSVCAEVMKYCIEGWPDRSRLDALHKEREKKWMDSSNYDRRHRVRNLSDLSPGDQVWITDTRSTGTVTSAHETPRS